ncbi:hypothetical protein RhiirC2_735598 [Rhizophagus irregularis]|uniref:Uncharacterized protein n=1 Tax=Rhizophagus irregularis TaxID=588596 RepID=A0A2N1NPX4_9GLOM|nr:hypothetical protein RhiirC2_735598 [Rhizophagus irregularis]
MLQVHVCNGKDASQQIEKFKDKSRIANFIGFKLDDESQFLCPLGDSPEEAQKYSTDGVELEWSYVYPEAKKFITIYNDNQFLNTVYIIRYQFCKQHR